MVQGVIAGGREALVRAIENAEDHEEDGIDELIRRGFTKDDVLVGLTASGQAPYVIGAMKWARSIGAVVGAISCNEHSKTFLHADHRIARRRTGSPYRFDVMKAGTAQKPC